MPWLSILLSRSRAQPAHIHNLLHQSDTISDLLNALFVIFSAQLTLTNFGYRSEAIRTAILIQFICTTSLNAIPSADSTTDDKYNKIKENKKSNKLHAYATFIGDILMRCANVKKMEIFNFS